MELDEINRKIAEYRMKLDKQVEYVPIKGGNFVVRKKTMSNELVKEYKAEISRLEGEKLLIVERDSIYQIPWDQVIFEHNQIRVRFNNKISLPWIFPPSRSSFDYIKPYLTRSNLPSLTVTIRGKQILGINNLDYFSHAVEMLNYKFNIDEYLKDGRLTNISSILNSLGKLSNTTISKLLSIQNKGEYLSHLYDIQSDNYKIIPAPEVFIFGNSFKEEDTFIFTLKTGKRLLLIWESINFARATYIFHSDVESYTDKLHSVFGYIVSAEKHKRSNLRDLIPQSDTVSLIQHDDFQSWKHKLSML